MRTESIGAWVRFILALLGLALAFAAAIFSTASRDAGNVPATVILASLALLLATAVGLGTVPYLARRVEAKRVRDALDFDEIAGAKVHDASGVKGALSGRPVPNAAPT